MDAERLISLSRSDLAESRGVPDVMASVWQAQSLAQAIGDHLALFGPQELKGDARGLGEIGGRGVPGPDHPVRRTAARAAQLSGVADPHGALLALGVLLGEVGIALVGVACATDEEGLYWQCIDAIDAADESSDRVRVMLRRLTVGDRARPPGGAARPPDRRGARPVRTERGGAAVPRASAPRSTGGEGPIDTARPERVDVGDPADSAAGS
ncbi:DUF6099 family protein [Streptomyces kanasensis]|uniref:DUF6099 family protein n=1 Tax=Streptomyces kanasensis TaxID=936756 RepID=UPI003820BD58